MWHDKDPFFIKAVGFEHGTKFCDPSPTIVTIKYYISDQDPNKSIEIKVKINKFVKITRFGCGRGIGGQGNC